MKDKLSTILIAGAIGAGVLYFIFDSLGTTPTKIASKIQSKIRSKI